MLHGQAVPAAIEVEWPTDGQGAVHVLLEGREDGVAGRAATVRSLLGGAAIETPDDPAGGATYPWDTAATGDDRATCLKLTFVLSGLADVLATARETGLHVRGSAGAGVAYAALDAGASVESAQDAVRRMRETCTRAGGSAVVVDAPAAVKAAVDVWGPVPALDLMRRVKDQFDPDHRLVAGPIRGRDMSDLGETGSIVDLGTPVVGGAFDAAPSTRRGADRRLRALRVLPADLPDLRAVGRGDGLAARPDLPDEGGPRGRADDRLDGLALRRLPRAAWPA